MSYLLNLSQNSGSTQDFTVNYPSAIPVKGNWELSLIAANLWYSYFNITAAYGNNLLRYYNGTVWKTITIPDGAYQLTQINTYFQQQMQANGDYTTGSPNVYYITLAPDYSTLKTALTISNSYQLDLTAGSINVLLGFNAAIYTTSQEGQQQVNITNGVNSLLIHCNAIEGSYSNFSGSDIIYSFLPQTPPGSNINLNMGSSRIYLPIKYKDQIAQIRMYITDQNNNSINLEGQPVSYTIHLRRSKIH